ncbi:MAG: hypothetical protein ACFFAI_11465 [Promethearchaeota archaeon]
MGICRTKDNIIKEIAKPTLDGIASMESELSTELDTDRKGTIYLNLSKEYKMMFYQYKDFLNEGMCKICEDENKIKCNEKNQTQKHYVQLAKKYLWKSVYYREKLLIMIKELGVIDYPSNSNIFMDVDLKYRYFVEYGYTFKPNENEKDFYFDVFGETQNESINSIINDLRYANRAYYYVIKRYEEDKNYEELSVWYEVRGDLYLAIQLLLLQAGEGLSDNAKLAYDCYKKRFENLQMFADPKTAYGGIIGMPYQTNFFDILLKEYKIHFVYESIQFKKNLAKWICDGNKPKKFNSYIQKTDIDFLPEEDKFKEKLNQEVTDIYPNIQHNPYWSNWRNLINFIHNKLIQNWNEQPLKNLTKKWTDEKDMHYWLQDKLDSLLFIKNEPQFQSIREVPSAGGNADHWFKHIHIEDKWIRDSSTYKSYPFEVNELIEYLWKEHKPQICSYAQQNKLGLLVAIDSRDEIRKNPSPPYLFNCYDFKIDEDEMSNCGICIAIFVFQVLNITPSKRK